jgi:hypothetical protein
MSKTIAEKLLIKPNTTIWLSHASHLPRLTPMPSGVREVDRMKMASASVIFADSAADAREILTANADDLGEPSAFWVAYPKAGKADINRDTLWPILVEFGMRPSGQVAIDDVWSAMRFRKLKAGEPPFAGGAAK